MIHVTLVRTDIHDMLLAQMMNALSPAERARAARFRTAADRRRHVVARTVLKSLLAEQLDVQAQDVQLSVGAYGKPVLVRHGYDAHLQYGARASMPNAAPAHLSSVHTFDALHFNLSHSGDLALIALAPVPVGIDLERDTPADANALVQAWFTPAEQGRLARGDDDFLSLWTAREAVLKAVGTGLSADPAAFSLPSQKSTTMQSASGLPQFEPVQIPAASAGSEFQGYIVAALALDAAQANAHAAIPPTLIAPYRAAIALRGAALPVQLHYADAARFSPRVTLDALAPASADAMCVLS
ncbi:4'-phosphopantetheinyl transferase superfamily protein [Pigmentiphaga aceris]|uniref:4'-phosphopantetheinyl transferase superfamily protein n=1 Tax=Pigmentiphaga aceris TaxID=1940612 RepID=A0A5C0AV78_9BURK|nr:4'-phosphopantetheinyl transferase superfamily protein [Pigmentiphaga aceris]QEI05253.1 4'-phosphopantetheinyl transferase superfamily protein [Pigmentiphaga aceris]